MKRENKGLRGRNERHIIEEKRRVEIKGAVSTIG